MNKMLHDTTVRNGIGMTLFGISSAAIVSACIWVMSVVLPSDLPGPMNVFFFLVTLVLTLAAIAGAWYFWLLWSNPEFKNRR